MCHACAVHYGHMVRQDAISRLDHAVANGARAARAARADGAGGQT